jgi:hypothetical protein
VLKGEIFCAINCLFLWFCDIFFCSFSGPKTQKRRQKKRENQAVPPRRKKLFLGAPWEFHETSFLSFFFLLSRLLFFLLGGRGGASGRGAGGWEL